MDRYCRRFLALNYLNRDRRRHNQTLQKIRIFLVREGSDAWQCIDKRNANNLSAADDPRSRKLIRQTTNAIEAFVDFGCIATSILQIFSLNFHETIW